MPDAKLNVAITGVSGYFGRKMLQLLDDDPEIHRILGLDVKPSAFASRKLVFVKADVRDIAIANFFQENSVEVVLHFAWMFKPIHDRRLMYDVDVNGTRNVLESCRRAGVKHMIIPGSSTVYGAHADNPEWLTEEAPLRPNRGISYSLDKAEVEGICDEFERSNPDIVLTRLRVAPVVGPNTHAFIRNSFTKQVVMIKGHDPPMQFIHEDDLARVLHVVILRRLRGVFNVATQDAVRLSEIAEILKKPLKEYSEGFLRLMVDLTWLLRISPEPSPYLELIKHRWTVSIKKLQQASGFVPKYTTSEALKTIIQ